MRNFICARNLIPWRRSIVYIDSKKYPLADNLFESAQVPIHHKFNGVHEDFDFIIVFASYNKKYDNQILDIMRRLDYNLMITKGIEYLKFLQKANDILVEEGIV